jgi:hypothetical protein
VGIGLKHESDRHLHASLPTRWRIETPASGDRKHAFDRLAIHPLCPSMNRTNETLTIDLQLQVDRSGSATFSLIQQRLIACAKA